MTSAPLKSVMIWVWSEIAVCLNCRWSLRAMFSVGSVRSPGHWITGNVHVFSKPNHPHWWNSTPLYPNHLQWSPLKSYWPSHPMKNPISLVGIPALLEISKFCRQASTKTAVLPMPDFACEPREGLKFQCTDSRDRRKTSGETERNYPWPPWPSTDGPWHCYMRRMKVWPTWIVWVENRATVTPPFKD